MRQIHARQKRICEICKVDFNYHRSNLYLTYRVKTKQLIETNLTELHQFTQESVTDGQIMNYGTWK